MQSFRKADAKHSFSFKPESLHSPANTRGISADIIDHFIASMRVFLCAINSAILGQKCVFHQRLIGRKMKPIPSFGFRTIRKFTAAISLGGKKKKKTFIVHKNAVPSTKTAN